MGAAVISREYLQQQQVKAAGDRAVARYNSRSVFAFLERTGHLNGEEQAQRKAADKAIKAYEDKGTQTVRFLKKADGADRVIKVGAAGFALTAQLLANTGVSDNVTKGIGQAATTFKDARTVFAIMNIFKGVLHGIVDGFKTIIEILTCLIQGDEVWEGSFSYNAEKQIYTIIVQGKERICPASICRKETIQGRDCLIIQRQVAAYAGTLKDTTVYTGRKEQLAGLLAQLGQLTGSMAYTVGFGLCSPIKLVNHHWKLGKTANSIGNQFPFVMMINHVGELGHTIGDFVHEGMLYSKAAADDESAFTRFWQSVGKLLAFAFEKLCELGADLFTVFKVDGPPVAKLALNFGASCISLGRSLNEGQLEAEKEIRRNAEETFKKAGRN